VGVSRAPDYLGKAIQRKIRRMIEVEGLKPISIVVPGGRVVSPRWPVAPSDLVPSIAPSDIDPQVAPGDLFPGTQSGDAIVVGPGAGFVPAYTPQYANIEVILNAGGAIISANEIKLDVQVDFNCVIVSWSMLADAAATARIDLWSDTYANFPPVIADTMPGASGNRPQITAAVKNTGGVSGWTKTVINAGDIIRVNLDTNDVAKRITLSLKVRKT
jgi:hypothetical protein